MSLQLTRPLAFFDLETTGVNTTSDRIVEISILKVMPDGAQLTLTRRINPERPIPPEVTKIHGISDADVKDMPTFKQAAKELAAFIGNADLAGYNSNKFDIPMLVEEFLRAEVDFNMDGRKMVDVQNIFHKKEPRTLAAAYKFYCSKEIENAHSAEADIKATYEVLMGQLERYPDLQKDVAFLHEFTSRNSNVDLAGRIVFNAKGVEVFNFGKHKDSAVTDVFAAEPSYYDWMMKGEFAFDTKRVITALRLKNMNNKLF